MTLSVQQEWALALPLQQQSVLLLAARGPDGVAKRHPCKRVVQAYRACVLNAAARRRPLEYGERADSFMGLDRFAETKSWHEDVTAFFDSIDELPHHYLMHIGHGAEILAYKHPDARFRSRWMWFYALWCDDMHLPPETEGMLDARLNDVFGPEREAVAQ